MTPVLKQTRKRAFHYYGINLVILKKLTQKEQDKIWDNIVDVLEKNLLTGVSTPLTKSKWKKMIEVIN